LCWHPSVSPGTGTLPRFRRSCRSAWRLFDWSFCGWGRRESTGAVVTQKVPPPVASGGTAPATIAAPWRASRRCRNLLEPLPDYALLGADRAWPCAPTWRSKAGDVVSAGDEIAWMCV
jgi:hypothetical protein